MGWIHADQSGSVSQGSSFNCFGRVYIESQDARNNYTKVRIQLWHGTSNTGNKWSGSVYDKFCRVDGAYRYPGSHNQNNNPWSSNPCIFFDEWYDLYHDANGNRGVDIWLHAYAPSGSYGPGHCYVSNSGTSWYVTLPAIDRSGPGTYQSISSVSTDTVGVTWGANTDCDYLQYSLNNGAWTDMSGYPTYGVGGLSPNTTYNIKTRARKTSNWVWGETGNISFTTHPTPVTISTLVASAIDPFTVTVSATTNSPSTTEKIIVNCNGTNKQINGGSGTVTFTVNPDTTYTVTATAYTLRSGTTNAKTTTVTTPADTYCYVIEPSGTVSTKKKMYLINTNGVKTEIKKQNVTIL